MLRKQKNIHELEDLSKFSMLISFYCRLIIDCNNKFSYYRYYTKNSYICKNTLENGQHPRDDYEELLELLILFLGDIPSSGVSFR
jgi:hypothetical protein